MRLANRIITGLPAGMLLCLTALLCACDSLGGGRLLVKTAASRTDIGGMDGVLLGSYQGELGEGWEKKEQGNTIFCRKDYTVKLGKESYTGEMKLSYRDGGLQSASLTFTLMDKPAEEATALYEALEAGLKREYDASMFEQKGTPAPTVADTSAAGSGQLEITDEQRDLLQLINAGGLVDLSVQTAEY